MNGSPETALPLLFDAQNAKPRTGIACLLCGSSGEMYSLAKCAICHKKDKRERTRKRYEQRAQITRESYKHTPMKKRSRLRDASCRTCGNLFVYQGRVIREYCSRECWYSKSKAKDGLRVCSVCKEKKKESDFTKSIASCKACRNSYSKSYYKKLRAKSLAEYVSARAAANFCTGLGGQREMRLALAPMLESALGHPCPYCATEINDRNFSFDHITPKSRGGVYNDTTNIHISCWRCNSMKGNISHNSFSKVLAFLKMLPTEDAKIIEARLLAGNSRFYRKT